MTISAEIIADTVNSRGNRLTTFVLKYPRFIHAELMTHRVFSRNASSSRAIPVEKAIAAILEDTAKPSHWGKNQPGMQADEELDTLVGGDSPLGAWEEARDNAIDTARNFVEAGYHKQIVNRILEPFSHITVIVSATEWENFYALRCHKDAQPEFQELAKLMRKLHSTQVPAISRTHLPFVTDEEKNDFDYPLCAKLSSARCARVSYLNHDGSTPSVKADLKLFERLVGSEPRHASPTEHQATPDESYQSIRLWGNLRGFVQYRKQLEKEWY